MIKVLFINPPYSAYAPSASSVPPLGLARVATQILKLAKVKVLDMGCEQAAGLDPWDALDNVLKTFKPNVVGIGPLVTSNVRKGQDVARYVRTKSKSTVIIIGGPDPSAAYELRLQECEAVNAVAVGEGEHLFPEFIRVWDDPIKWKDIQGVAFKHKKLIHYNGGARLSQKQYEQLPIPEWSLFPIEKYKQIATKAGFEPYMVVEMSRGCPYRCSFCVSHVLFGHRMRLRPPGLIVAELEEIVRKFGYRRFSFNDDNIGVELDYLLMVCGHIHDKFKGKIEFTLSLRPDSKVFTCKENLIKLQDAGLKECFLGCESADPIVVAQLNKTTKPNEWKGYIIKAVEMCREVGVACRTNWMIGLPKQTENSFLQTIELIKKIHPNTSLLSMLQPYPGTEIEKKVLDKSNDAGLILLSKNPSDYIAAKLDPSIETKWLSRKMILNLVYRFISEVGTEIAADVSGSPYYLFEMWQKGRLDNDINT